MGNGTASMHLNATSTHTVVPMVRATPTNVFGPMLHVPYPHFATIFLPCLTSSP